MLRDELIRLVKFDPEQLREAIKTCDQEAEKLTSKRNEVLALATLYREILRIHGFEGGDAPAAIPDVKPGTGRPGIADRRFRSAKIADAVVTVLSETGGKLHGRRIIEKLTAGGLKVGGKYPMSTLTTAMRRDARIEKDPTEKNTWRLKNVS